ncbi:MAG: glycosyltransferase [Pseudomonadales bacterium]
MKIVQLFDGHVPPAGYGGIERMVFWLARALVQLGHEVTVVAQQGGEALTKAGIDFVPWPNTLADLPSMLPDAELLHFHQPFPTEFSPHCAYLITEHGNHRAAQAILPNTVFLSKSHANNHGAELFVHNGLPLDEYPPCADKERTMLFMAKLGWRKKNAISAINLALDNDLTIKLCGGDVWSEKKLRGLWRQRAQRGDKKALIQSCGNVDGIEKLTLLQSSGLLFYAVNWQEPFALAPHEAMACGTPVLATPNGALGEYIVDGENGYLVTSYQQANDAIDWHLNRTAQEQQRMQQRCIETAFSIQNSARAYLALYERLQSNEYLYPPSDAARFKYRPGKTVKVRRWLA